MKILSIDWDYFFTQENYTQWDIIPTLITNKPTLIIETDHDTILQHINPKDTVTNLDAHHDSGYWPGDKELNCGNWTQHLNINYTLYYPNWRKLKPESLPSKITPNYGLPNPTNYDKIFICKSPEFIHKRWHYLWDNFTNTIKEIL